jgi:hypothetical protein
VVVKTSPCDAKQINKISLNESGAVISSDILLERCWKNFQYPLVTRGKSTYPREPQEKIIVQILNARVENLDVAFVKCVKLVYGIVPPTFVRVIQLSLSFVTGS